jgi:hypothetical protein
MTAMMSVVACAMGMMMHRVILAPRNQRKKRYRDKQQKYFLHKHFS